MKTSEYVLGYLLRDICEPGEPGITLIGPPVSAYAGIDHRCCPWVAHDSRIFQNDALVEEPSHGLLLRDLARAWKLAEDCGSQTSVIAVTIIGELQRDIKLDEHVSVELDGARPNKPEPSWNLIGYDIARLSFESVLCCIGGYDIHSDNGQINLQNGLFFKKEEAVSICCSLNAQSQLQESVDNPEMLLWVLGLYDANTK